MAEHAIYLVPSNPQFLPDNQTRQDFLDFFKLVSPLPNANGSYYYYVYQKPNLIDSGEGLEAVICPICNTHIDIYENEDWWEKVQEKLSNSEEKIIMPCCEEESKLLDFKFYSLSAFAMFAVGALEPSQSDYWEDERTLKQSTIEKFEEILGCPILIIWSVQ